MMLDAWSAESHDDAVVGVLLFRYGGMVMMARRHVDNATW